MARENFYNLFLAFSSCGHRFEFNREMTFIALGFAQHFNTLLYIPSMIVYVSNSSDVIAWTCGIILINPVLQNSTDRAP